MGAMLGGPYISPITRGIRTDTIEEKSEHKESSLEGDYTKGSKEGSSQGELRRLEAPQEATEQNPFMRGASETPLTCEEHLFPSSLSLGKLEGLTEGRYSWFPKS
jgi:hypothetical protein